MTDNKHCQSSTSINNYLCIAFPGFSSALYNPVIFAFWNNRQLLKTKPGFNFIRVKPSTNFLFKFYYLLVRLLIRKTSLLPLVSCVNNRFSVYTHEPVYRLRRSNALAAAATTSF